MDLTGVFANAILGGVIARRQKLDPVGFAALAILSGLGGGMIRDTLLQHGTPMALTDYAYILTALAGCGGQRISPMCRDGCGTACGPFVDALALGCWAAPGAQKTLGFGARLAAGGAAGHRSPRSEAAPSGTSCSRRIPGDLRREHLYATAALAAAGAWCC